MIKYVVFDFDGTLVDSRAVFILSYNQIADAYGFKPILPDNLDYLKKLSMLERFKALNVPLLKLPPLTKKFLSLYSQNMPSIELVPGIEKVLQQLYELNVGVSIVSSNSTENIQNFLQFKNITTVSEVLCSSKLFGKDKIIKQFLKKKNLQAEEVLYIGDEWRDVEACLKLNVTPIWVSWGYEDPSLITNNLKPEVVATPEALLNTIKSRVLLPQPL